MPAVYSDGAEASITVARALRREVAQAVAEDVSVGNAVTACMALLVAAAVATGESGNHGR